MDALTKKKSNGTVMPQPFDTVEKYFKKFEDMFETSWSPTPLANDIMSNMSTQELDDSYVIHLQAVGMSRNDISITMDGDMIEIEGKTSGDTYIKNSVYYKFTVPNYIDTENLSARLENGILMIRAPKKNKSPTKDEGRQIEIE